MASKTEVEEAGTSSSGVDTILFPDQRESQSTYWDEKILEGLNEQEKSQRDCAFFRNVNRLEQTQAEWWEFSSQPDLILQRGSTKYFVELKHGRSTRRFDNALSDITTRDVFRRNLLTFFPSRVQTESSLIELLTEVLAQDTDSQLRFRHMFAQLLSPQGTRTLTDQRATARGSPQAVLRAMDASPHPSGSDIDDLLRIIKECEQSSTSGSLFPEKSQ